MIPTLCIISLVIGVLLARWWYRDEIRALRWRAERAERWCVRLEDRVRRQTPKVKPVGSERMRQMGLR